MAAALALALAAERPPGAAVEVEERQGIARLFDVPPLPYEERKVAIATGGGEVRALAVDVEAALLEYFEMFYNLGFAGRSLKKMGAVEFATTLAPGLRDVLLTGKVKETVTRRGTDNQPVYDDVVMDAPPTGRVVTFLSVTEAMSDLAKRGPIHSQAEGVVRLLHSPDTIVHLVTLLRGHAGHRDPGGHRPSAGDRACRSAPSSSTPPPSRGCRAGCAGSGGRGPAGHRASWPPG